MLVLTRWKSLVGKGGNFEINPGLDWEPVKLVHPAGVPSTTLDEEATSAPADSSISVNEPTLEEVTRAINKLRSGHMDGLGHVTPTILGSTVGYPSDSLASCYRGWQLSQLCIGTLKFNSKYRRPTDMSCSANGYYIAWKFFNRPK